MEKQVSVQSARHAFVTLGIMVGALAMVVSASLFVQSPVTAAGQSVLDQAYQAFESGRYADAVSLSRQALSAKSSLSARIDAETILINSIRWQSGCDPALREAKLLRDMAAKSDSPGAKRELGYLNESISTLQSFSSTYQQEVVKYRKIIDKYPGKASAARAKVLIARLQEQYGKEGEAGTLYAEVLEKQPNTQAAEKAVDWVKSRYAASGDYAKGADALKQLAKTHESTSAGAAAYLAAGELLIADGKSSDAAKALRDAMKQKWNSDAAGQAISAIKALHASGVKSAAVDEVYSYSLKVEGEQASDWDQAYEAFETGRYQDAIDKAKQILQSTADTEDCMGAEALIVNGVRWRSGSKAAADEAGVQQAAVEATRPDSTDEIALVSGMGEDFGELSSILDSGVAECRAIIQSHPNTEAAAQADLRIAGLMEIYGGAEQEGAEYFKVAADYPDSEAAESAVNWLWKWYASKASSQGVQELRQLVQGKPESRMGSAVALAIGKLLLSQGDTAGALSAYRESITRASESKSSIQAVEAIKDLYVRQGQPDDAVTSLTELETAYTGRQVGAAALAQRALVYAGTEQPDQAYAAYKKLAENYSTMPLVCREILNNAIDGYYQEAFDAATADKPNEVLAGLTKALALKPGEEMEIRARYQKGICHYTMGDYVSAQSEFEKIMREHPTHFMSVRAQEWVEKIPK